MKNLKKTLGKIIMVILGSVIAAYGITLAIYAGFGSATLAVLWQGVSQTLGISMGSASLLIALLMILFVWFYDRRQIHWGTMIYQIVYSLFVDIFAGRVYYTPWGWGNFILMLLGIVVFAIGTGIYASADYGRGSYEAVNFALAEKNNWKIRKVRALLDLSVVLLGMLLGGKIGACTIATLVISGAVIQKTVQLINRCRRLFGY